MGFSLDAPVRGEWWSSVQSSILSTEWGGATKAEQRRSPLGLQYLCV